MFILAIILMDFTPVYAAQVRGFVVDAASHEPLPAASVTVENTDLGATTNLDGYFVLSGLPAGRCLITVSYLGYNSLQMEVDADGVKAPLRISLKRKDVVLKEAVVSLKHSDAQETRKTPLVSAVPVDGQLIKTMPSMMGEMDVLRALQQIPGVKASSDLSSALHIRGGSPDQTLILMDHNVVYNPSHLFGLFSAFNADAVKHIDLIKGGFPAQYGGRSGSVLDVITNEGNRRETHGLASIGLVSARGALEGPLPKTLGSYAFSGRRTYFDPVLIALRSAKVDVPNYFFYDANGKVNFDLTDCTTLSLAGYIGNDIMNFDFGPKDERVYFYLKWGNQTLASRLRHCLRGDMFLSVGAAVSEYHSGWGFIADGINLDEGRDRMLDKSVKTDFEYYGLPNHTFKGGAWISRYDIRFKEGNEDLTFVDVDEWTTNYSLYAQDKWRVSPFFEVQPGLRGYYHAAGDHFAVDPRLAMVYYYDPRLRLKAAVGRYSQWLNLITFGEGFSNFDLWIPVDKSMNPSHSHQAVLGFECDHENGMEFTTEGYYTRMHDIAAFNAKTDQGEVAADAFVNGEGCAYGWEVMATKKRGRLTGWVGYSLSWTKRRFPNSLINWGNWFYPQWDRRHDFIAVAMYPLSRTWDLAASWRYNTGQGYTQALGIYTTRYADMDPSDFGNYGRTILTGSKNNYRFPSDHRLDVTLSWKHLLYGKNAVLNISIFNAYSRRPFWTRWFDTNEDPMKITDLKLLPILPLVSYEVKF
ncbi:MAG: TonB-dependent receptor [Calditrichaeota bacterium]|nr:TonB-dependent receptor [Calditrichota bacterium]